jgi:hypothetical protein
MAVMGDDVGAGTVSRPGHGLRQPHDRREPCLFHIHTNQTKPHYAEAVPPSPDSWCPVRVARLVSLACRCLRVRMVSTTPGPMSGRLLHAGHQRGRTWSLRQPPRTEQSGRRAGSRLRFSRLLPEPSDPASENRGNLSPGKTLADRARLSAQVTSRSLPVTTS